MRPRCKWSGCDASPNFAHVLMQPTCPLFRPIAWWWPPKFWDWALEGQLFLRDHWMDAKLLSSACFYSIIILLIRKFSFFKWSTSIQIWSLTMTNMKIKTSFILLLKNVKVILKILLNWWEKSKLLPQGILIGTWRLWEVSIKKIQTL